MRFPSRRPGPHPERWRERHGGGRAGRLICNLAVALAGAVSAHAEPSPEAKSLAVAAATAGDPLRGAEVFARHTLACLSCHRIGEHGGRVGPALDRIGAARSAVEIVASLLHPQQDVEPAYRAVVIRTADGRMVRGYPRAAADGGIEVQDPVSDSLVRLAAEDIEETAEVGSLMPDRLLDSLAAGERQDLVRFLADLGRDDRALPAAAVDAILRQSHAGAPASFSFDPAPLDPLVNATWQEPVNRERVYDFYAKEARFFRDLCPRPPLTPPFPGLEGHRHGHWGTQNEETWRSNQWNEIEAGSVQCGVLRAFGQTIRRAVCVQLAGGLSACFDPDTLSYPVVWKEGFVSYSDVRAGFLGGLTGTGIRLDQAAPAPPRAREATYEGFCRHGREVGFLYRIDGVLHLDVPRVEAGRFVPVVAPLAEHPCRHFLAGGPPQWPEVIETRGERGQTAPLAVDRLTLPHENPWRAKLYCGGHDFLPDGGIAVCTMQGDVWRVDGVDESLSRLRWRRIASGLHQPLGLLVVDGVIHVLGRDQITRLHDANADGEIDRYECFSRAYRTSAGGHDYVMGLERDTAGRFLTASSNQGLLRIAADGRTAEVLATGLRNPDGLGVTPDGMITVASSEGEWVPASMVAAVRPDRDRLPLHFGHRGPRSEEPPALPLVYLPRGMDNSSGGQVWLPEGGLGPLGGHLVHLSYGAGTAFLLLRDEVAGQLQGAIVPLPVEFRSGSHRGRFRASDGCLYVCGMGGWGTYTPDPGCLERVRHVGEAAASALPTGFHVHDNGVVVRFAEPVDPAVMGDPSRQFAQCWNYRYSPGYGSPEFSTRHEGVLGHDQLPIRSCHVFEDGRAVFLEMPAIAPVNQLQLCLETAPGKLCDLVLTVHALDASFRQSGVPPRDAAHPPHPILADLARLGRREPNPFIKPIASARPIAIRVGPNLSFLPRTIEAEPGEPLELTLENPDVVPHNWALARAGSLDRVGDLVNRLVTDPAAAARQYIPATDDILAHTDIVSPQGRQTIHFHAPAAPGRYPFLCTFPGHWMVMNGELVIREGR
ncbi:MAG: hypothetical protein RLZZ440_7 [Planctomycetota bacterium]